MTDEQTTTTTTNKVETITQSSGLSGQKIRKLTQSAMGGFGLGMVIATLTLVSSGVVVTTAAIMTNPFVIVFTMIGLGMGFE